MKHAHTSGADGAGPPDEMLRILAHDVRGPLSTISVAAGLLEAKLDQTPDRQRPLEIIRAAVRQIDRIVEDVLTTRAAEAETAPSRQFTEAGSVVRDVLEQHRDPAELRGVRLQGAQPPTPVFVAAAREPLLRAVTNLVTNAIRHTSPGGAVQLAVKQMESEVAFLVADTGTGMDQAEVERLLLRAAHGGNPGAHGHGLSIVHGIARRAGGALSAVSRAGAGSTFIISIPAARLAEARPRERRQQADPVLP
jgi:two-component system, OmpR family, sensor kinase